MKLPWTRRADDAARAAEIARRRFEHIQAQRPIVEQITEAVRKQREQNHFADALRRITGER